MILDLTRTTSRRHPNDKMNTDEDIEIAKWRIKHIKDQVLGDLCLGYALGHNYNLGKAINVIWG